MRVRSQVWAGSPFERGCHQSVSTKSGISTGGSSSRISPVRRRNASARAGTSAIELGLLEQERGEQEALDAEVDAAADAAGG